MHAHTHTWAHTHTHTRTSTCKRAHTRTKRTRTYTHTHTHTLTHSRPYTHIHVNIHINMITQIQLCFTCRYIPEKYALSPFILLKTMMMLSLTMKFPYAGLSYACTYLCRKGTPRHTGSKPLTERRGCVRMLVRVYVYVQMYTYRQKCVCSHARVGDRILYRH